VMYDSFAQPESDHHEIAELVASPQAAKVVVYTWNFQPELIANALEQGVRGYLSKTLPARELVAALEAVHAGEIVVSEPPRRTSSAMALDWPRSRDPRADHPGQK